MFVKKKDIYIYIYARLSMGAWLVEGQVKSLFGMSDLDTKRKVNLAGDFCLLAKYLSKNPHLLTILFGFFF